MDLFKIWLANLDRTDIHYYRRSNTLVENEHLSPSLVNSISGKILSMQSLSDRLASLERELYVSKALLGGAVVIASLIFAAIKIDGKAIFRVNMLVPFAPEYRDNGQLGSRGTQGR